MFVSVLIHQDLSDSSTQSPALLMTRTPVFCWNRDAVSGAPFSHTFSLVTSTPAVYMCRNYAIHPSFTCQARNTIHPSVEVKIMQNPLPRGEPVLWLCWISLVSSSLHFSLSLCPIVSARLRKDGFLFSLSLFYFSSLVDLRAGVETKISLFFVEWIFFNVESFISKINYDRLQGCMSARLYMLTRNRVHTQSMSVFTIAS